MNVVGAARGLRQQGMQIDVARLGFPAVEVTLLTEQSDQPPSAGVGVVLIVGDDVAIMMALLKISRLSWEPTKRDSWVDVAGYAACGYEIITNKEEQQ